MRAPHYVVKRARSGRFNFTLLTDHGRITGSVLIQIEKHQTRAEINEAANAKIRALVDELSRAVKTNREGASEPRRSELGSASVRSDH